MKTILALETSCDETAVAVLRGRDLLASEVSSQVDLHEPYGGVVPEVASRNHLRQAPRLLQRALERAGTDPAGIDAFAATSGPGLASSLMIGASIAKGLALATARPYLAINHLEGHLLSPFFGEENIERHVGLVVSGGHTLLVEVRGVNDYRLLGRTQDDAAGEAFDKVAKMLGLGYPGGPAIEATARGGDPARYALPRSMAGSGDHDFSFSGLKTAVRYLLPGALGTAEGTDRDRIVRDICASFQAAVVSVLTRKAVRAAQAAGVAQVAVSGGVSGNGELRRQLKQACDQAGLRLRTAEPGLCTDNAAMIAFAASLRLAHGLVSEVTEEIDPNLRVAA